MSEEATTTATATLQLQHDGKSNVLRIRRGVVTGRNNIVVDFCKQLPRNQDDADVDCLNKHVVNRIAQSTDFICSHSNCSYHHKSETRYILHARSHISFEVTPDALYDTEFRWEKGRYTCSKCPRTTTDWISFREHIRHHIVEKPYKCSLCMIAITSVPELRLHFQKYHFGKQADFEFNGSVYDLNILLGMLLPEANPVTDSLNISFKVPENTKTRISGSYVLGDRPTHPVDGLVKHLVLDDNSATEQQGHSGTVEHIKRGKYEYTHGTYRCITCCFTTKTDKVFARHAWKHIHDGWQSTCTHNTRSTSSSECAVVNGLLVMLKRVALARVVDNMTKKIVSHETVSVADSQESESPEDAAVSVTAQNSDDSLPDVLHAVPGSEPVGTELPAHSTGFTQEQVMQTSNSDGNIVIRHDQDPLKERCQKCSFTCNNAIQLEVHMKSGHQPGPVKLASFRCPECSMSTVKKEVLFWHLSHHIGSHSFIYYGCSRCSTEKQLATDVQAHIAKKHADERLRCSSVQRVETVHYLQNIMKCPVCNDGLVWKQIFIAHLQDKHGLSDLTSYLDSKYGEDFPHLLSFPGHLLKSSAGNQVESFDEEMEGLETPVVSRFHCENCEFSTSDSSAYLQHWNSHSKTATESSSTDNSDSAGAALSSDSLNRLKPLRSAQVKANSQIITPPLAKQAPLLPKEKRNQSPKRKPRKLRQKLGVCKKTTSRLAEYSGPYFTKTNNATDTSATAAASKKAVTRPADDNDFLTEFVSKLPSSYVFADDIKCPRCYFTSRVRINLLRHVKSHMNDSDVSAASGDHLSYDLWQPGTSSMPSDKPAEAEPKKSGISKVRNKNDNQASHTSSNGTDAGSRERSATPEADTLSQISESRDSNCDIRERSADEDDGDDLPAQPETLTTCETCLKQFDSDVSLERHVSRSHGGPYVCSLCGILMWQQNAVRSHYSIVHPDSPLQFETLRRKTADGSREVAGAGTTEKKIARVQGIMKETQLTESIGALSQQKQSDASAVVTRDTEVSPPINRPMSTSSLISVSEAPSSLPSTTAANTAASLDNSVTVSSAGASQLPPYASFTPPTTSSVSASFTAPILGLPFSLDSLMATIGSQSIAMIANQLVPMLANLDSRLLMQMLQVANPALAAALSSYCTPPAAATNPMQVPTTAQFPALAANPMQAPLTSVQPDASAVPFPVPSMADGFGAPQNQTSVNISSASSAVTVLQSAEAVQPDRSASMLDSSQSTACFSEVSGSDSESTLCFPEASASNSQSTVSSSQASSSQSTAHSSQASAFAVDKAVGPQDSAPSDLRDASQSDRHPSPFDVPSRPASTASTSSSMYSTDRQSSKHNSLTPPGTIFYTCHLCSFRSFHRTRFAEHLSSEFCTKNIVAMARTGASGGESTRRKHCSQCSFSTFLSEEFDNHVRIHDLSNLYHCTHCKYTGPTVGALRLHFRRSHPKYAFAFHESASGQKSDADHPSRSGRSSTPQPQSINLDPVVDMRNLLSLDCHAVRKLKNQHGVATITYYDL